MFNFVFSNDPKTESFQSQLRITDHHWCTQGTTNTRTFKMAGLQIFSTLKSKSGLQIWPGWKWQQKSFPANDQSNQTDHCPSSKIFSPSMNSHLKLRRPSKRTMTTWYTLINGNEWTTETDATEWRRKARQMKNLLHHTSIFQCKFWNK